MSLSHNTLRNYFEMNFALVHHHKYSLSEVENLMPWEREVYVTMLLAHLEELKEKQNR